MICLCFREGVYTVQVEGEMVKTGEGMVAETEVVITKINTVINNIITTKIQFLLPSQVVWGVQ